MILRRISKKNTLLLLLFWVCCWIFVTTFLFVHRTVFSDRCTDEESTKILAGLCYDYTDGAVTGDLCEDLCVTKKLIYKHCLYYHRGKKVIHADWQGNSIILKSKNDAFSKFQAPDLSNGPDPQSISDTDLLVMVAVEIKNVLGLDLPNNTIMPIWTEKKKNQNWKVELASMWSLFQQEEYLLFNLLQDFSRHVLQVIGTCGHFYAVEFLSAGHSWKQNLFSLEEVVGQCKTGEEKMNALLDIAISFLDMVHQFDTEFSHRLHLCDVKPENFAIRSDLTVICDKIFRRWFSVSIMESTGPYPLQAELHRAVQQCAQSANEETLFTQLYHLLRSSQKKLQRRNM